MNVPEKEILQLLNTYKTAAMAKDVNTFISLYAQEVVIYDMWSQWSYQGRTAWQNAVNNWFNSLGDEQVIGRFSRVPLGRRLQDLFSGKFCNFVTVVHQQPLSLPMGYQ